MRFRPRFSVRTLAIFTTLVCAYFGWLLSNPLRRSDVGLRAWLLTFTPVGTSEKDVFAFLKDRGWNDDRYQRTWPAPAAKPFLGGRLGGYAGFPWYVWVDAFWEIDVDGKLSDIRIQRTYDSP